MDLELTSVLPYAHWNLRPGLGVWGMLGAGWGEVELEDEAGRVATDLTMRMAAGGLRREVATWREIDLALKADAFLTELKTEAAAGLPKTSGDARRLRLRLEGRRQWEISPVSQMAPSLEIGGRWDGGSAETGLGGGSGRRTRILAYDPGPGGRGAGTPPAGAPGRDVRRMGRKPDGEAGSGTAR